MNRERKLAGGFMLALGLLGASAGIGLLLAEHFLQPAGQAAKHCAVLRCFPPNCLASALGSTLGCALASCRRRVLLLRASGPQRMKPLRQNSAQLQTFATTNRIDLEARAGAAAAPRNAHFARALDGMMAKQARYSHD